MKEKSLVRAMAIMGGGIVARGGPCGALIGGVTFLSSFMGKDEPEKKDDPQMWKACNEFYKRFEREVAGKWGSVNCRDIAAVDWRNQEQVQAFYEGDGAIQCANNTGKAALILGEVLEKYMKEKHPEE